MSYCPAVDELTTIAAAQAGDESAKTALFVKYRPALENHARTIDGSLDADSFQDASVILLETIEQYEPSRDPSAAPSLAPLLRSNLSHSRRGNVVGASFSIPGRTFRLYRQIMAAAEGDAFAADALLDVERSAGGFAGMMSHSTFARAHAVLQTRTSDDGTTAVGVGRVLGAGEGYHVADAFARFETSDALLNAMHALSADQREVVLRAFGFVDCALSVDCVSDSLIAADLGLSRAKVQRLRTSALSILREHIDIF